MKIWQYIFAGIIGAFLGFALQYIIDNGGESWVTVNADNLELWEGHHPERIRSKPFTWTYRLDGMSLGNSYFSPDGIFAYPRLPDNFVKERYAPASKQGQWKTLWYQLRFLNWLQTKGDIILRTATIAGILLPLWMYFIFRTKDKQGT